MPFVFQLPTSVRYDSPHFLWYTYASLLRWLFKNEEIDLYSIDKPRKVNVWVIFEQNIAVFLLQTEKKNMDENGFFSGRSGIRITYLSSFFPILFA